ncbi:antitoxin VbhA family protein [Kribbella sp. NPDC051587]|uniref:antitoxin VbhA family protein n=1 Tax=Kribbella sp. NPDC051587 TaxID=3364119 RepID=UPI0037AF3CAC
MAIQTDGRISDAETAQRAAAVESVRHSTELEHGRSTDAGRALQDAWAAGELTLDQYGERLKALYGVA